MSEILENPSLDAVEALSSAEVGLEVSAEAAADSSAIASEAITPETFAPTAAGMQWFVVHAYSGMEKAAMRNIAERVGRAGMDTKFGRILVPEEEVVEVKNGQKKMTQRKFFPGYVLVEMAMDDDTWHLVKSTSKVMGFVGGARNRPVPISEKEVRAIVEQMHDGAERPRNKVEFTVGEMVRVKSGPFADFNASVEGVNYEKSRLQVSVTIFGRATPVDIEFSEVEKV